MLAFFRPAPDAPPLPAPEIERAQRRWRLRVFVAITLGYTVYYLARTATSVSKDSMIGGGALSVGDLGLIDSVFLGTYAVGKTINGFIADHVSVRRLFATALLVSAVANIAFGLSSAFIVFLAVWALNGWVQSVGVPASGVVMATWFPPSELGTRYSVWSMAHHLGEGLAFILTSRLIVATGSWRAGYIGPGLVAFVAALVLYRALADRPAAVGLPAPDRHSAPKQQRDAPPGVLQREVLANPWILLCGLASGLVYVSRYAILNWGVYYLQHEHGYSLEQASTALSISPITGIAGTLLAGPTSDRLFGGRRVPVALGYGLVLCGALAVFYSSSDSIAIRIALACSGFATGGLLVFLGGLLAMELTSKRAAGAALGVIGGFSYLGAGLQSLASSRLIEAGHGSFAAAKWLWLGAPCAAVVLTLALWRAEAHRRSTATL